MDFGYRPYLRKKFKKIELALLGIYIVFFQRCHALESVAASNLSIGRKRIIFILR